LRPDDGGARLPAGGQVTEAMVEQFRFLMAMDTKLCEFHIHIIVFNFDFHQYLASYSIFVVRTS
jgi:hypothetical protein